MCEDVHPSEKCLFDCRVNVFAYASKKCRKPSAKRKNRYGQQIITGRSRERGCYFAKMRPPAAWPSPA